MCRYVQGICCPSETPVIERLLLVLPGVSKVMVNVPNRTTTVDHDAQTTAGDLVLAL
jgi:copper chaperone CopZ|eukprot:COSAG01_NODE_2805_length_7043_cov_17.934620_4_plen_57_part_00